MEVQATGVTSAQRVVRAMFSEQCFDHRCRLKAVSLTSKRQREGVRSSEFPFLFILNTMFNQGANQFLKVGLVD